MTSRLHRIAASLGLLLALATAAQAAPGPASAWTDLTPAQRSALAPLKSEWAQMDGARREKWLELAGRFTSLPAAERQRIQARMSSWANLSPAERGNARLQFQEAQRWTPQERQERWEAYQSLHPQARQVLAERWKLDAAGVAPNDVEPPKGVKRNILDAPGPRVTPPKAASPTSVRAAAGATTQPISRASIESSLHQPGIPKIAATEAFVDPATMLPRRGPQGAAVTPPKPAPTGRLPPSRP